MTTKEKQTGVVGRPTSFRAEFVVQAYQMFLLGLVDREVAQVFGVSERTLHSWRAAHPAFRHTSTRGKAMADANVAHGLYQKAVGASMPETVVHVIDGLIVKTEITKNFPPCERAASLWLRNRQPALWRDRVEIQAQVTSPFPAKEVLDAIYAKGLAEAEERDRKVLDGRRERMLALGIDYRAGADIDGGAG